MLGKNFAKEIQYQLAHETLKNPLNYLKNCRKPKRENHKTKDFIKGCTCSEKKAINFNYINVYRDSPQIAGEKRRPSRPNSQSFLIENLSLMSPCQTIDVFKRR